MPNITTQQQQQQQQQQQHNNRNHVHTSPPSSEQTSLLLIPSHPTATKNKNNSSNSDNDFFWTTTALAVALLVQSYLLVSVFPYSGFLSMHLIPELNEETAGSYAGMIASSFMIGRMFSSFHWGRAADHYGRVFVIQTSLLLSAIFSILFGLSTSFTMALVWRFILGLVNGLIGPIKTLVSEITHGDLVKETRSLAIIFGMWGYGFLLNPAISGYLSDPVKQYNLEGYTFLESFPYFLPNLVGCLFCLGAFALVRHNVQETLPADKRESFNPTTVLKHMNSWGLFQSTEEDDGEPRKQRSNSIVSDGTPIWVRPSPSTTALALLDCKDEDNTCQPIDDKPEEHKPATIGSLWRRKATRQHLLVYWFYSFLVISVDEVFPLYCISKGSGLGIQEATIGNILCGTGVFYVIIQYVLVTQLVQAFGYYKTLRIGALLSIPVVIGIPFSLVTNQGAAEGALTWGTLAYLAVIYAISRAFSSVTFSCITMTTNKTVPAHQRATMNGLSMLGGSLAKGAGPAFTGILFSQSAANITPPYGSVIVYGIVALLGLGCFVQTMLLPEIDTDEPTIEDKQEETVMDKEEVVEEEDALSF